MQYCLHNCIYLRQYLPCLFFAIGLHLTSYLLFQMLSGIIPTPAVLGFLSDLGRLFQVGQWHYNVDTPGVAVARSRNRHSRSMLHRYLAQIHTNSPFAQRHPIPSLLPYKSPIFRIRSHTASSSSY